MLTDVSDHNCTKMGQREQIEAVMARLKLQKRKISDLRIHCEELKKRQYIIQNMTRLCPACNIEVKPDQDVILKDSFGKIIGHYHKECFKQIWVSNTWKFDYLVPGFLKPSERDH
jgi:hypothetical protein